ncbi:hypothetical protein ARMSODRAFT_778952 [Armillaria solidipes]|uniref:Uncharacterized protein n=1 Tax=Armillaria solidipes TaxID=1076256 RepID=A0A2H3BKZ5_9AGAR|nr:hypothetical protein ARMSODRAFT_778952 [Armillaria solidipes]
MTGSVVELEFPTTKFIPDFRTCFRWRTCVFIPSGYRANVSGANIFLKVSSNEQSFEDLTCDAGAHQTSLGYVQGSLIPYIHGYYKNEHQGCLISEDCKISSVSQILGSFEGRTEERPS